MNNKSLVLVIIFIFISFILIFISNTIQHEETHKAIANNFGCIKSTITYFYIEDGFITSSFSCNVFKRNLTEVQRLERNKLDGINEIVGYNIFTIVLCFFVLTLTTTINSYLKD